MKRYDCSETKAYISAILEKFKLSKKQANTIAYVLVEADMRGVYSHGTNGLPHIVIDSLRQGKVSVNNEPKIIESKNSKPTMKVVDANGCLGHVACMYATELVKATAREYGTATVHVINSQHFGSAGVYTDIISAEGDLSGQAFCLAGALVIPYGGDNRRFGTNPIAWSMPFTDAQGKRHTVNLDAGTSTRAANNIVRAIREGLDELPFAVVDLRTGKPTKKRSDFNDERDFFSNAALMPAGGLENYGDGSGYKTSGMAWLIELQTVMAAGYSPPISSVPQDRTPNIRQTFKAEYIGSQFSPDEVLKQVGTTVHNIKEVGGPHVLYPGEKEERSKEDALKKGIPYTEKQIETINQLGAEWGLAPLQSKSEN